MEIIELVKNELSNLEKELDIILLIIKKNQISDLDDIEIRGASLSLGALYNGVEKILVDLLKDMNIIIKNQNSWHTLVLEKAYKNRIISEITFKELKGFLAFRHFIRHTYSFDIDPKTIKTTINKAPGVINRFVDEIESFI